MFRDFVLNGQGHGSVGATLANCRFDHNLLRPFFDSKGYPCVNYETGNILFNKDTQEYYPEVKKARISDLQARGIHSPVFNATTLRKEEWIKLDTRVVMATRQRLRAWADLQAANSVGGFNAMGKTTYEYEAMSDPGEAVVDMDALTDGRRDRPLFKLRSIPLPITHSDFEFSQRQIMVSRNSGTPLDTTMAEAAGRRVGEMVEQVTIGTQTGMTFGTQTTGVTAHDGTSTVYGYTNYANRVTKTDLHTPTSANPENVIEDIIEMRETMYTNGFYGPFVLYYSTGYDRFLDDDYFRTGGTSVTRTLRERVTSIDGISSIRRLDYLTSGYQLVMVQMTAEVAEAINGMEITTVQWESKGGLQLNFKVMCIKVPLLKAPYNGVAGIIHGTTS